MTTLIKNGYLLNPADKTEGIYDILIEDGIITQMEPHIDLETIIHKKEQAAKDEVEVIDAADMYVMPGLIDLHVHLREPGFEYKETIATGARAAAAGGYTTICPMPNTKPVIDSKEMAAYLNQKAKEDSPVHIVPIGAVTVGQMGKELSDISGMAKEGIKAISEDGKSVMDVNLYVKGMRAAREANIAVFAHCENKDLVRGGVMNAGNKADELGLPGITNAVEDVITARDIFLAEETGVRLHLCHCSTRASVKLVKMAKELGIPVTAEVCPHHFSMSDEEITGDSSMYKMNPPLRSPEDVLALKEGLRDNIMDVIATDHAPHSKEEKEGSMLGSPFGIVGLETAFALAMTELVKPGYLTPMQLVEKMSMNPARILGVDKGNLAVGKMADITIANPKLEYEIDADSFASKGRNTPFNHKKVIGKVVRTIVNGKTVFQ